MKYLLLTILFSCFSYSQIKTGYGRATTSYTTKTFSTRVFSVEVCNDTTAGNDTLFVCINGDTGNLYPILKTEKKKFYVPVNTIKVKTSANTIPYRIEGE